MPIPVAIVFLQPDLSQIDLLVDQSLSSHSKFLNRGFHYSISSHPKHGQCCIHHHFRNQYDFAGNKTNNRTACIVDSLALHFPLFVCIGMFSAAVYLSGLCRCISLCCVAWAASQSLLLQSISIMLDVMQRANHNVCYMTGPGG
jgi:hypothetical protein